MEDHQLFNIYHADAEWTKARRKELLQEVVCFFKRCSVDMLSFDDVSEGLHLRQKIDRGVKEIPLDSIKGSVGRYQDFSSTFLPRKKHLAERWKRLDVAMVAGTVPPIEVYQVGEAYFVVDGNHRVSISRQHGAISIEAQVWEYTTPLGLTAEADINEVLCKSEHAQFIEKVGRSNEKIGEEIVLTCPQCYDQVTRQIETYRHSLEKEQGQPVTFEAAVTAWYQDVYLPSIKAIGENDLMDQFPDRTESDLFIWAWKNSQILEELNFEKEDRN